MATNDTKRGPLTPDGGDAQPPVELEETWSNLLGRWRALRLYGKAWNHTSAEAKEAAKLTKKLGDRSRLLAEIADEHLNGAGAPLFALAVDLDDLAAELVRTNGPWSVAQRISGDVDDKGLRVQVERAESALRRQGERAAVGDGEQLAERPEDAKPEPSSNGDNAMRKPTKAERERSERIAKLRNLMKGANWRAKTRKDQAADVGVKPRTLLEYLAEIDAE